MKRSVAILFFIAAGFAEAQEKWTYRECINYAIENNLELEDFRFAMESRRLDHKMALSDFLPSIGGNAGYDINIGKAVDPNTNNIIEREFFSNTYGISGSLLLFDGFRRINQAAFEKFNLTAARETLEQQKNALAFQVLQAYIDHLIQTGLWEIQLDQVELSKQEVYRIGKLIQLGMASGSEQHETEARLAQDEFLLVQLQNLAKRSRLSLKMLMNLPPDSVLMIEAIEPGEVSVVTVDEDSLYKSAEEKLPRIKALNNRLEAARKNVRASRSGLMPSIFLWGSMNTGYFETYTDETGALIPFKEQFDRNLRMGYGLSLQIPLFDGFRRRMNVQRSVISREQMKNALKIGLRDLAYEIEQAILDWEGAASEYDAALKREESMTLAFKIAERKREKGLISIMEYFEAKNNLGQASAEALRTRLQLFLMDRTVKFYSTGSLIESWTEK